MSHTEALYSDYTRQKIICKILLEEIIPLHRGVKRKSFVHGASLVQNSYKKRLRIQLTQRRNVFVKKSLMPQWGMSPQYRQRHQLHPKREVDLQAGEARKRSVGKWCL